MGCEGKANKKTACAKAQAALMISIVGADRRRQNERRRIRRFSFGSSKKTFGQLLSKTYQILPEHSFSPSVTVRFAGSATGLTCRTNPPPQDQCTSEIAT